VSFVDEPSFARSNYWLNALLLDAEHVGERDEFLRQCNEDGLLCRPVWTLMHRLPIYADCPRMPMPVAESVEARLVNLPSGPGLAVAAEG